MIRAARPLFFVAAALVLAACATTDDEHQAIRQAVREVLQVQRQHGEQAAIEDILGCYAMLVMDARQGDACLAKDIAYTTLAKGMYRHVLAGQQPPPFVRGDAQERMVRNITFPLGDRAAAIQQIERVRGPALQALREELRAR